MTYKDMFNQQLIDLEIKGGNEEAIFEIVAKRMEKLGYVNGGYFKGITTREQSFPTGLITQHLNIALPHADPEFVEKPFVYVARLSEPITVKQMGDSQEMITENLFFLGIKNPTEQVGLLQAFMNLFMDKSFVDRYKRANDQKEIYQLFVENI